MNKILTIMILTLLTVFSIVPNSISEESIEDIEAITTENDTVVVVSQETTTNEQEERRQYERYKASTLAQPVTITAEGSGIGKLIDISRGGIAVKHSNTLKEGDIIPVHIVYKDIEINTEVRIVSATETRAGAEYLTPSQSTTNKLLYLSILLEADNNLLKTKLST